MAYTLVLHLRPISPGVPSSARMIHFLQSAGLALMGICVATAAWGQSLWVEGPAGARVVVDGETVATLPMDARHPLDAGLHLIRCELPGHVGFEDRLTLDPGQDLELLVSLLPLRRRVAVGSSLLLAGSGHHYLGRSGRGWTLMGIQVAAGAGALLADTLMKERREDHVEALEAYRAAFDETELLRLRQEADDAYSSMETWQTWRRVALGAVVGVAVLSAVDAWIQFDRVIGPTPRVVLSEDPGEVGLAWSFGF